MLSQNAHPLLGRYKSSLAGALTASNPVVFRLFIEGSITGPILGNTDRRTLSEGNIK